MLQLAYQSRFAVGVTRGDAETISAYAQLRNRADEITGVLIAADGQFLQVIEGPKESVENTFLRIMTDPRHHDLLLLSRRLVTTREFGVWDMALCQTEELQRIVVERIRALIDEASEHVRQSFFASYPT